MLQLFSGCRELFGKLQRETFFYSELLDQTVTEHLLVLALNTLCADIGSELQDND